MRVQSWSWLAGSLLVAVLSMPTREQGNRMYLSRTKQSDLESLASGYVFEDLPADKLSQLIEGVEDLEGTNGRTTLKPIRTPTSPVRDFLLLPLTLEPEAEMLPAHYTGVKPPGVDHMEIVVGEPASSASVATPAVGAAASYGTAARSASGTKAARGRAKSVDLSRESEDSSSKDSARSEAAESAGRRKAFSGSRRRVEGRGDSSARENGEDYEVEGRRESGRNAVGSRKVYHKDEYKKDADFYDRSRQGAHFKKHGRVEDKHAVAEGVYEKDGSSDSGFRQAELDREAKSEKARNAEKGRRRADASEFDGFFQNFDKFSKDAGAVLAEKLAFSKSSDTP